MSDVAPLYGAIVALFGILVVLAKWWQGRQDKAQARCLSDNRKLLNIVAALVNGDGTSAAALLKEYEEADTDLHPIPRIRRPGKLFAFLPFFFLLSCCLIVSCRDGAPTPLPEVPAAHRANDLRDRQVQAATDAAAAKARGDDREAAIQEAIANKLAQLAGEQEHVAQAQRAELQELRAQEAEAAEQRATAAQARRFGAYGIIGGVILAAVLIYLHAPLLLVIGAPTLVSGGAVLVASWWTSAAWVAPLISYTAVGLIVLVLAGVVVALIRELRTHADEIAAPGTEARRVIDEASRARQWPPVRWVLDHLFRRVPH